MGWRLILIYGKVVCVMVRRNKFIRIRLREAIGVSVQRLNVLSEQAAYIYLSMIHSRKTIPVQISHLPNAMVLKPSILTE